VVSDAETSADRHLALAPGIPGEAKPRGKVIVVKPHTAIQELCGGAGQPLRKTGSGTQHQSVQMAVPIGGRRVVLITQTDVQGEIVIYFPVVLNESRKFNSSQLLADGGRRSRNRIHQAGHLQRPVICKAQDVGEIVARNIVAGVDILRGIASKLAAELDRVGSMYPGENILEV